MKTKPVWMIVGIVFWGLLAGCTNSKTSAQKRAERATQSQGDIVLGIVDSSAFPSMFREGVELAVHEINEGGGILEGRRLKIVAKDDQGRIDVARKIARELAKNLDVVAVIGHHNSEAAIAASIIYERAGILFLTPLASDPSLTRYGGDLTFRNIPNGEEEGKQAADFAFHRRDLKKFAVVYQRDEAYKRIIERFNAQAGDIGMDIVIMRSFIAGETDFRSIIAVMKKQAEFDGIFIAGSLPAAGILVKQIRDMGITAEILGSSELDSPELWTIAGRAAEGAIVMTVFDPRQPNRLTGEFVKRFRVRYGLEPDAWAAQGYDAIQVLVAAIEGGTSTVPIVLASTLRFLENWSGVTGSYAFTTDGDITGKPFLFKIARNGSFEFLKREAVEIVKPDPLYVVEDVTLRLPLPREPETIDPGVALTPLASELIEQLFLGLTSINQDTLQPELALAKSFTVSDDGKTYTYTLRDNVSWTDGQNRIAPVTAHDVVFAIRRNIQPETHSPNANLLYVLHNGAAIHRQKTLDASAIGVQALDDNTVQFTLERPVVYFPMMLNHPVFRPQPKHVIEQYGENWTDLTHLQTNGSYYLAAWEKGTILILRQNPHYYDLANVGIPELRYYVVPSSSVGMAMYEQNELDVLGGPYSPIPPDDLPRVKAHPVLSMEYEKKPVIETVVCGINTHLPPMDNLLVRKAIAAATDRQMLIQLGTRGDEDPAVTLIHPQIAGARDPLQSVGIQFNPQQAQKWLAEAGYPGGKGFPELLLVYPIIYAGDETYPTIASFLKEFLKAYLKISVKVRGFAPEEYLALLRQEQEMPPLFLYFLRAGYSDANSVLNDAFYPVRAINLPVLQKTEFAELLDRAMITSDQDQRNILYTRAEKIVCEQEIVVIPLYYRTAPMLIKLRVKNLSYMPLGGQHLREWILAQGK